MAKVMREVPAHEVLRLAAHERGYRTVASVHRALEAPPYNHRIGRAYLPGIFNGTRPLPGDELLAALLHLLGLNLRDLGMEPSERPVVWMAVEYARRHGWPQPRPGREPGSGGGAPHRGNPDGGTAAPPGRVLASTGA